MDEMPSLVPPEVTKAHTSLSLKIAGFVLDFIFSLSLFYYFYFFVVLELSQAPGEGIGLLVIAPFILIGFIVAFLGLLSFVVALHRIAARSTVAMRAFWGIAIVSILYSLFALFIFPNIGQAFTVQLVVAQNFNIGDELTYQVKPSSGFYTRTVPISLTVTTPSGSVLTPNIYPKFQFLADTYTDMTEPGCHLFFTLLYCVPSVQNGEFYLSGTSTYSNNTYVPFQFEQPGTYTLSSPTNLFPSVQVNVAMPTSGLPAVLGDSAIIKNIPGFTLTASNEHFNSDFGYADSNDFLTFSANYSDPNNQSYVVSRSATSTLTTPGQFTFCGTPVNPAMVISTGNDCYKTNDTPESIATTTVVDGNTILIARSSAITSQIKGWIPDGNQYYDQAYWISGDALLKIEYQGQHSALMENVYATPLFQAYIKQYPSTMPSDYKVTMPPPPATNATNQPTISFSPNTINSGGSVKISWTVPGASDGSVRFTIACHPGVSFYDTSAGQPFTCSDQWGSVVSSTGSYTFKITDTNSAMDQLYVVVSYDNHAQYTSGIITVMAK
jgi:hypothetical protein